VRADFFSIPQQVHHSLKIHPQNVLLDGVVRSVADVQRERDQGHLGRARSSHLLRRLRVSPSIPIQGTSTLPSFEAALDVFTYFCLDFNKLKRPTADEGAVH